MTVGIKLNQLEGIAEEMPRLVYWKDANLCYLGGNQDLLDALDLKSEKDLIGKSDMDLLAPEEAAKLQRVDREVIASGKERLIEEAIIGKSGRRSVYCTRKMPLLDDAGNVVGLFGLSIDITCLKSPESRKSKIPGDALKFSAARKKTKVTTPNILVVEDHPVAAMAVRIMLEFLKCKVHIAKNGTEALERAENEEYHLVFMDLGLPDIGGLDVTRKIRTFESAAHAQVPIVALTAHVSEADFDSHLEAGVNKTLIKPPQLKC